MIRQKLPAGAEKVQSALQPLINPTTGTAAAKFAVVWCGNMQYKVSPGDVIAVQRIRAEIGSEIVLRKIALVGGARFTAIGRPLLENARVVAAVEEQKRMRSTIHLQAPYAMRATRWKDLAHAATILRVTSVDFQPEVVGEVDKYSGGVLQDPSEFEPEGGPNRQAVGWAGGLAAEFGNAYNAAATSTPGNE